MSICGYAYKPVFHTSLSRAQIKIITPLLNYTKDTLIEHGKTCWSLNFQLEVTVPKFFTHIVYIDRTHTYIPTYLYNKLGM